MQKVICVNILSRPKANNEFSEYELPEINKYLKDGYKVVQVYQSAPSPNIISTTITFILEKNTL